MALFWVSLFSASSSVVAHDPAVSIQVGEMQNMCLDLPGGDATNGKFVQLWTCNGHQNQLWYFDAGSNKIQVAADDSKCVDAGSMEPGSLFETNQYLYIWDCLDVPQQRWCTRNYEEGRGHTIYLCDDDDQGDSWKCMHIPNRVKDGAVGQPDWDVTDGFAVGIFHCNEYWQQKWNIWLGLTIRMGSDNNLCLDLPAGEATPGTELWLWQCNGGFGQYWIWEYGSYAIKYGRDPSKCVDAGAMEEGSKLMLWDCNGYDQQQFGYDAGTGTIYLVSSGTDASLCLDIAGGEQQSGGGIDIWGCNGCWNQQFNVVGPPSFMGLAASSALRSAVADCPQQPNPTPVFVPGTPAPPPFWNHCWGDDESEQHDLPVFRSPRDVYIQGWDGYFTSIYGDIPMTGYPICLLSFWMIRKDFADKNNVYEGTHYPSRVGKCPTSVTADSEGQIFEINNGWEPGNTLWIFHQMPLYAINSYHWVEVTHSQLDSEEIGMWFFTSAGSGVWYNVGNTLIVEEHNDGCNAVGSKIYPGDQYVQQNNEMCAAAAKQGYNSIQFTAHKDDEFKCGDHGQYKLNGATTNVEIVATELAGKYTCGESTGQGVFRTGWEAKDECHCDNNEAWLNCKSAPGYPPVFHSCPECNKPF